MGLIEKPKRETKYGYYPSLYDMMVEEAKKDGYAEIALDEEKEYLNLYVIWKKTKKGMIRREKRIDGKIYVVLSSDVVD